jgi:hypothetical protein
MWGTAARLRLSIGCPVPPSADIHGFDYAADAPYGAS